MTEPNHSTDPHPDHAGSGPEWPAPADGTGDAAVDAVLLRLVELPGLPVADHGEVYAGLHEDLAAALNEDVAGAPAGDTRP